MTALAGLWKFGSRDSRTECGAMIEAQRRFGPHGESIAALGEMSFGRALFRLLPEDRFDRQPVLSSNGRFMLVADVRLDNRDELLGLLGGVPAETASDSSVLLRAWENWGPELLERLLGDFAFAVWDQSDRSLFLARDPVGQRPLHYHLGKGFAAFASMPVGLHALAQIPAELDEDQLASFVADIERRGPASYYKNVRRVEPGHVVTITPAGERSRDYWRLPTREIRFADPDDYIQAFREQLDRATAARLRRAGGSVAAHLSAGLDSNAVAATAARLLDRTKERLIALTSAPRIGFDGPVPPGRIADESALAAATARLHPNMDHVVIRDGAASPLQLLGSDGTVFGEPIGLPCNHVWWSAINRQAEARGATVMLTGEAGNLTISAGSLSMLADLVRTGKWGRWLTQARAAVRSGGPSWRGVLATSFGPYLPGMAWTALTRLTSRESVSERSLALLAPGPRSRLAAQSRRQGRGAQPERNNQRLRWRLLRSLDSGNFRKEGLARWQIDERDPTADRRLAEFCLAVPADILFAGGVRRRLARIALSDRVPAEVLDAPRGYQFADWYEQIDQESLRAEVERAKRSEIVPSMLDLGRLDRLVSAWPPGDWGSEPVIATYRVGLLRALSAGRFACQTA